MALHAMGQRAMQAEEFDITRGQGIPSFLGECAAPLRPRTFPPPPFGEGIQRGAGGGVAAWLLFSLPARVGVC